MNERDTLGTERSCVSYMQKTKSLLCAVMDVDQIYHYYVHFVLNLKFFSHTQAWWHMFVTTTQEAEIGRSDPRIPLTI